MLFRIFALAVSATVLTATLAEAQGVRQLGGPRNLPPAGFTGQQFADNDGCVYLRAGFGGQTTWVPRISANRRPLCGFPPTFGAQVAAAADAAMAPDPQATAPVMAPVTAPVAAQPAPPAARPVVAQPVIAPPPPAPSYAPPRRSFFAMLFGPPPVGNPIPLVPVAPPAQQVAQPVAQPVAPPQMAARPAYTTPAANAQAQCVPGSPVLETVVLRSGGAALVCTRGDGTLIGWRPPLFANGMVGAALTPRLMQGARLVITQPQATARVATANPNAVPKPPKGYKLAWTDDRLNPMRGIGTAAGQAQQDQVWTRDIPAQGVVAAPQAQTRVAVSTMSAPAPATRQAAYVQVGTFGQPANADGVRARLSSLGLPVSTSQITHKGKVLQIVYAGPFATTAEAQSALATTHSAGYGDAILK